MEYLSAIFGLSMIVISVAFARHFFTQMRVESRYRQEIMNEKQRRDRSKPNGDKSGFNAPTVSTNR